MNIAPSSYFSHWCCRGKMQPPKYGTGKELNNPQLYFCVVECRLWLNCKIPITSDSAAIISYMLVEVKTSWYSCCSFLVLLCIWANPGDCSISHSSHVFGGLGALQGCGAPEKMTRNLYKCGFINVKALPGVSYTGKQSKCFYLFRQS